MRVCFLVTSLAHVSGINRVISLVGNALVDRYDIYIVATEQIDPDTDQAFALDPRIHVLSAASLKIQPSFMDRCRRFLSRQIQTKLFHEPSFLLLPGSLSRRSRFSMIHYFKEMNFDVIVGVHTLQSIRLAQIRKQIPSRCIGWQHSVYPSLFQNPHRNFWKQEKFFKEYITQLDDFIVLNDQDKEMMDQAFSISSKVIANPLSFSSKEKADPKNQTFIAVGSLMYVKGFDRLIDAFALFHKKHKEWTCHILGEGRQRAKLEQQIQDHGLQDFIFLEGNQKDVQSYYRQASVFLLPSRWEGLPMVALEAMEMGLPMIAFDILATKGLIEDGVNGKVVCASKGVAGYAQAMDQLASSLDLRIHMHKQALQKAKQYEMERILPQCIALLENKEQETES